MNVEWNLKTIIVISVAVILFITTNVGQYFVWWGPKSEEMKVSYDSQLAEKQAELDRIGPMVTVWTIREGVNGLLAGMKIELEHLDNVDIPESLINPSYILDPTPILGKYFKIGLKPGTLLSWDLVMEAPFDDTTREFDIVANVMPIGLKVGDFIDYRIVLPLGEDFIVLTHKRIEAINDRTLKVYLNEQEIHIYQSALIDYFLHRKSGTSLYITKYIEPGIQMAADPYYAIPKNIQAIMIADPNIIEQLDGPLNTKRRELIDAAIASLVSEQGSNIASGRNEINGVIDQGKTQFENDQKSINEANAALQAQINASMGNTPQELPVAAPTNEEVLNEATRLQVEDGVVE